MSAPVLKLWVYPEPVEMAFRGMDKLASAQRYLEKEIKKNPRWMYDTPPDVMKANLQARVLLTNLAMRVHDEALALAKAEGWL